VTGARTQGSGFLIDNGRVLTVSHLGFVLHDQYVISNVGGQITVECVYISVKYDFALLHSKELPNSRVPYDAIGRGQEYFILVTFLLPIM
jgi:S1-C subfamily serine protease